MTKISVTYKNHMGSDLEVANDARVSFAKMSEWEWIDCQQGSVPYRKLKEEDARLINFLARGVTKKEWEEYVASIGGLNDPNKISEMLIEIQDISKHWAPFAHQTIKVSCTAPVPIVRQAYKHKIGFSESEESRRYIKSTPEIFIPEYFRSKPEGSIKQGSGEGMANSDEWIDLYKISTQAAVGIYNNALSHGMCPEQARFFLPQGTMVNWIWSGNLASFARFYNQRTHHTAQKEIQDLAHMIGDIIEPLFPVSWVALTGGNK